jgi:hypothetical protein
MRRRKKRCFLYDAELFEFLDIVACAVEAMTYECEPKIHTFITLPAELRLNIYGYYLDSEQTAVRQGVRQHLDDPGQACCVWRWPSKVALCDGSPISSSTSRIPFGRALAAGVRRVVSGRSETCCSFQGK